MPTDARSVALAAGAMAALLHAAGALKSVPPLGRLPFDLTAALAIVFAPALALLLLIRDWRITPAVLPGLAAFALLLVWLVVGASWSVAAGGSAAKLRDAVLLGPPMLLAGLVVGGDDTARRGAAIATLATGPLIGVAVAWGLISGQVVLGGPAETELVRVQYQHAGMAMASAAGLAALTATQQRGPRRWLAVALVAALAALALLPGGRAGLAALALAAGIVPMLALLRAGRTGMALVIPATVALIAGFGLALLLAQPELASGLRTVERLATGDVVEASLRLPLWRAALDLAGETAPFGVGTGAFPVAAGFGDWRGRHPHNHALEALAELGLPGLLLWAGAWGGALMPALRRWRELTPDRVGVIASLALPTLVTIMVSTDLGNRMAWFALGLMLSLGVEARPAPRAAWA